MMLQAPDGFNLSITAFCPEGAPTRGVILAGAMATPQRFYYSFAKWLAEKGAAVVKRERVAGNRIDNRRGPGRLWGSVIRYSHSTVGPASCRARRLSNNMLERYANTRNSNTHLNSSSDTT